MSLLIPGLEVRRTYRLVKKQTTQKRKIYKANDGPGLSLRPFKGSKRRPKPAIVLKFDDGRKASLYCSKLYGKKYGYGHIQRELELVIVDFESRKMLEIVTIPNGWLYYPILLNQYIDNKGK